MYKKTYRYKISDKNYRTWLELSRASDEACARFPEMEFHQTPRPRIGGGMDIEEVVSYPSKEVAQKIEAEMGALPGMHELWERFQAIVDGELREEESET
jgi:hypothetical protein